MAHNRCESAIKPMLLIHTWYIGLANTQLATSSPFSARLGMLTLGSHNKEPPQTCKADPGDHTRSHVAEETKNPKRIHFTGLGELCVCVKRGVSGGKFHIYHCVYWMSFTQVHILRAGTD